MIAMKPHLSGGRETGFAMLFAVLTSSVLLSIGLSIFNLTVKELALSSAGRESQAAFYASDSGVECALYWDVVKSAFATSSESYPSSVPSCAGQDVGPVVTSSSPTSAVTTFSFAPTDVGSTDASPYLGGTCVLVTVSKDSSTGTHILSRGYNVGYLSDDNAAQTGNRCAGLDSLKVERALLVNY